MIKFDKEEFLKELNPEYVELFEKDPIGFLMTSYRDVENWINQIEENLSNIFKSLSAQLNKDFAKIKERLEKLEIKTNH